MMTASAVLDNRQSAAVTLDRRRYRRVLYFFTGVAINLLWWEVVLRRVIGARNVSRNRTIRFRRYAREFRKLAAQMGGVMIKLGQFVSARVDVMPPEITNELSDLQDIVPPESYSKILPVLIAELGDAPDAVFAEFDPVATAAASLGQVHKGRLLSGEKVIVKVQRPGIGQLVATDLSALRQVAKWAMWWTLIRKRANVPALLDEFAATLWQELDYHAEADHAERFQALFTADKRVYVPSVHRTYSTLRVITLEDVTSIKVTDYASVEAAGISREIAARQILDIYLQMIFEFGFFHADPHPGNLFLYPLPAQDATRMYGSRSPYPGSPFYVVFVDFGMVGHITDEVKRGLREMLIAIATRDATRIMASYEMLGVLLPGADKDRIVEAQQEMLNTVWGRSIPELARMPRSDMHQFAVKYRDVMFEMPFQIPQDFIYLARAVGMLSGLCTGLDPKFNPWEAIAEYAQKYVARGATATGVQTLVQEAGRLGQTTLGLPNQLQEVLSHIQGGDLRTQIRPDDELRRELRRLDTGLRRIVYALIFVGLLTSATLLTSLGRPLVGYSFYVLSAIALFGALIGGNLRK